ncbi:MAG: hypothetical protein LRY27_00705 [Chitinophagales bacterium]|nr:hypothetical protein [Chitinophagales bacterium]
MWEWNYIYGAILVKNYLKSVEIIKSLREDKNYPFINTDMFSLGAKDIPFYYDDRMISFAATYKYFGYEKEDWKILILKIEHLLRRIGFISAQFHISGVYDEITLFWYNKDEASTNLKENYYTSEYDFIKTDEWYFGYGFRNLHHARLESKNYNKLDLLYPIDYNNDIIKEFIERI